MDAIGDDYPRLLRVLADVGDPLTLVSFRERVLDALATRLDLRRLTFFLGTPPGPDAALWDPATLGVRDGLAEAYRERFQADDVILTAGAQALVRRTGVVSMTDVVLAAGATPGGARFVEEFLAPQRVGGYLAVWLDTRLPVHGYLAVLADDQARLTAADRARLAVLRVHLAQLLRLHVAADPAAAGPPAAAPPRLTGREQELARLVAAGLSNREIAAALVLSEDTVKKYVSRLMAKLGVVRRSQVAAARHAP